MKATNVIRWICVAPVAIAGWYATVFSGMFLLSLLNDWCPYGEVVSGLCNAPWFKYADNILFPVFAGLSASFVVLLASWVAPTRKMIIAVVAYVSGAVIAVSMGIKLGAWLELAAAMGAGLVIVFLVYRRQQDARTIA